MHYKFRPFEGPGRWEFKDPEKGQVFQADTKEALIARITAYRAANKFKPIEMLPFVIESYLCTLPENKGRCDAVDVSERGWLGYINGGVALVMNMVYDRVVHQNVADERSKQCAGCKFNVPPPDAGTEAWANKIALLSIGERKSVEHVNLGKCAVCSCPMRAKVFFGGKIDIEPEWRERMEEVNCWQLKGNS